MSSSPFTNNSIILQSGNMLQTYYDTLVPPCLVEGCANVKCSTNGCYFDIKSHFLSINFKVFNDHCTSSEETVMGRDLRRKHHGAICTNRGSQWFIYNFLETNTASCGLSPTLSPVPLPIISSQALTQFCMFFTICIPPNSSQWYVKCHKLFWSMCSIHEFHPWIPGSVSCWSQASRNPLVLFFSIFNLTHLSPVPCTWIRLAECGPSETSLVNNWSLSYVLKMFRSRTTFTFPILTW